MQKNKKRQKQLKKLLSAFRKQWSSTTTEAPGNTWTPPSPPPSVSSSAAIYLSIHKLPLHKFIDVDVDGDLSALIIDGSPTREELLAAWDKILSEFHEAIGDVKTTMRLFLFKEITLLRIDYNNIFILVDALRSRYVPYFHQQLNLLTDATFEMESDPSTPVYKNTLLRYLKRSKDYERRIELKQIELDSLNDPSEKKITTTHAYYEDVLISLTDFSKVAVTDQITTYAYCSRVRRLNAFINSQKRKNG